MPEPILRTKTGGYSLLTLLILIAGAALVGVQIFALFGPAPEDGSAITRFLPGIIGVVFVVIFLLGIRNGHLEIYNDRIKGKTSAGKPFDIDFGQIGTVDVSRRVLLLKDEKNQVLVSDKASRYARTNGLLWLLTTYPELQSAAWGEFNVVEKAPQNQAVRFFEDEEDPIFGDRGFVFETGDQKWFLPVSNAALLPPKFRKKGQLAVQPSRQIPVPQQDINPAHIPLEATWNALVAGGMAQEQLQEIAQKWAEAHNGCLLEENENKELTGEMAGWRVRVVQ